MPALLSDITAEAIADRLEIHPGTVTLEAVKSIYLDLNEDAYRDGHVELASDARDAAAWIQELIDTPEPRGLVASARLIGAADQMLLTASGRRYAAARAYDRFDPHTAQATEALEILTAYSVLLEAADFELRTGLRAA